MLIYLEDEIIEVFKEGSNTSKQLNYFENILYSHVLGKHFVFASRKGIDFLKGFQKLSETMRGYMTVLDSKYATIFNFLNNLKVRINVILGNNIFRKININDSVNFEISLDYFEDPRSLESIKVISENIEDSFFYKECINYFPLPYPIELFDVEIEETEGNGNGIGNNILRKNERKNMLLIITDSDKKYPEAEIGATAKEATEAYESIKKNSISKLVVLDVHEKENMIPYSFYKICNSNSRTLEKLKEIEEYGFKDFQSYFDFKQGINTDNFNQYHERIIEKVPIIGMEKKGGIELFNGSLDEFIDYRDQRINNKKEFPIRYILEPINTTKIFNKFSFEEMRKYVSKNIESCESNKIIPEYVVEEWRDLEMKLENPASHLNDNQRECIMNIVTSITQWGISRASSATGS